MHTLNAVFLLGDTALNCLVTFLFSLVCILDLQLVKISSPCWCLDFSLTLCSDFLGFELLTSSYGPQYMSYSSGSFMLLSHCGNTLTIFSTVNTKQINFFILIWQNLLSSATQVALSISWLVISICSIVVCSLSYRPK